LLAQRQREFTESTIEAIRKQEEFIEAMDKTSMGYDAAIYRLEMLKEQLFEETVALRDAKEEAFEWTGALDASTAAADAHTAAVKRMKTAMMGLMAPMAAAGYAVAAPYEYLPGAIGRPTSFQQGGIVAQTGLALVHKGETVIPQGQPTTNVFHIYLDGEEVERTISERIIREVRLQGG